MARTRKYRRRKQSRRQRGGVPKVFYIYTLGMGSHHFMELITEWIHDGGLLDNLLLCIPDDYTSIEIVHYETMPDTDEEFVRDILTTPELGKHRVVSATYINEPFNAELVSVIHANQLDYLIYSFSAALSPSRDGRFIYRPFIGTNNQNKNVETYTFNAICDDYYGLGRVNIDGIKKYFEVNNGRVVTFIQKLLQVDCNPSFLSYEIINPGPGGIVNIFYKLSIRYIRDIFREFNLASEGVDITVEDLSDFIYTQIFHYINEQLWYGMPCQAFTTNMKDALRTSIINSFGLN
jgi:hypothetical protein